MAAELVGGALLSAFLQVAFDKLASPQFVDFFRRRKFDEKLLANLNIMLHSINSLADDAEQKQFRDPHVKAWLFAVKEAVFDAEDLLDEINYELTRCEVEAESQSQSITYKVSNFFNSTFSSFNKKTDSGLKDVLEKLEYLSRQKGALGLKECSYSSVGSCSNISQKLPSTSLVVESVIYGRDADKEIIFNWLTSKTENHNQPSILSIVVAWVDWHVYNDPKIDNIKFDIKVWVCVSDHFDVLTVTKTILEAIDNKKDDSGNLEMVHKKLKEKLSGRKFLLVLDDVWNEKREEWEAVRTPLSYGAPGSRIIVTTRAERVASNMRSEVHRLKQLEEDECWKVFIKHALKDDDLKLNDEQKEIGRRIVEKCKGLPLALKTIGSLLHTKSSISDWKSVLASDIWDLPKEDSEIIPALFLSYHYLPSHLKRCFAYCAIFPKDYEFVKKELIFLWMTENILHCPQQIRQPVEVGEEYFNDLLSRSFFQQSRSKRHFVIHDLLNDLAKYVCADFCFRLKFDKGKCIPKATRHFSFAFDDVKCFDGFGSLTEAKRLRSFIPLTKFGKGYYLDNSWNFKISIHDLCSKMKFLRVLSFNCCSDLREVPDSVSDLKHLRSLDLSSTEIRKLPDSTCLLYNLLILKLNYCLNLEEFPSNLHKLTNLCCLEFKRTKVTKMPIDFGELKNLQVLNTFIVDKNSEFSTKQLGGLDLHGRLSIKELQNIKNSSDALVMDLKNKTHLVTVKFKWNKNHILDDPRKEKKVFENLQPSKQLETLGINNYGGTEFPNWVFDNSLSNLVFLQLKDCKYCLCLPPLGLLSSLKTLKIIGLDGIVSIGDEFYGSESSSFKSLERLEFYNMKECEEWECKTDSFPLLQTLSMNECPKMKGLSEQLLHLKKLIIRSCEILIINEHYMDPSSLKILRIYSCPLTNVPITLYNFLEEMEINGGCDFLTTFPLDLFPKLCSLKLTRCRNLQRISQEHTHNHLKYLIVEKCPQFESFPSIGLSAPWLQTIEIRGAENLKLLPRHMQILLPSLTNLHIIDCAQVEMFPNGGLPSNVKYVSLSSFKLIASLRETLDANTCLELLYITNVDVESFPGEVLLPHSLTSLQISCCPNLKKIDYKALPQSISTLNIWDCPLLQQCCQNSEDKD
ncbi:hypothetical protein V8G54_012545 [Vigna mungo]|uniref:Disease resistance RPP13-like protein 1 n=1 Tax=Vigna mungo TaxID=3915 RepID=A0AAQ3S0P7_VIGMU